MRPLDPLSPLSPLAGLLAGAPAAEARAAIERLVDLRGEEAAALSFARGALALREGRLDAAVAALESAAAAFVDPEAAALARAEALLAAARRGPRAAVVASVAALVELAASPPSPLAGVVALHYRGAAERAAGDAVGAQRSLLAALAAAEPAASFLAERAQILNSLGTLHVALGSHGAALPILEHAAELHRLRGDVTGEAIAHGQLGAAALAQGRHDEARRHLQRQEWLASRIGDRVGQSRALTFLADVALDTGRAADAADLAARAQEVAEAADPPLALFAAYAKRALGRARLTLGDFDAAAAALEEARARFVEQKHPLGMALTAWDLARLAAERGEPASFFEPAWALASLGLAPRVAAVLVDRRALALSREGEAEALAAVAESAPALGAAEEVALSYAAPASLAAVAARRTAARRNLGRLGALSIAPPGLWLAVLLAESLAAGRPALPPERASAAAVAALPGAVVWAWPSLTAPEEVARDLAAARAALGGDTRAFVALRSTARVASPPFLGEVSATVEGASLAALLAPALALPAGALRFADGVVWPAGATGLCAMAGYVV
jgi:tetratricopeptide (TPR) repeat protein